MSLWTQYLYSITQLRRSGLECPSGLPTVSQREALDIHCTGVIEVCRDIGTTSMYVSRKFRRRKGRTCVMGMNMEHAGSDRSADNAHNDVSGVGNSWHSIYGAAHKGGERAG